MPNIHNTQGHNALKANAINRALSVKRLQEHFRDFRPYWSLWHIQERSRYQVAPLHRAQEREELYAKYQAGVKTRKIKLRTVTELEDVALAIIRAKWKPKRLEIEQLSTLSFVIGLPAPTHIRKPNKGYQPLLTSFVSEGILGGKRFFHFNFNQLNQINMSN